jgi:hypothetical protein
MKVVIINGKPQSGKDTFILLCKDIVGYHYVQYAHFAETAKKIAEVCGWNGEKDDKSRKFLADLTDLMTEYNDYPFKSIFKEVVFWRDYYRMYDVDDMGVAFICVREPKVIDRFKKEFEEFGIPTMSLLIRNDRTDNLEANNNADNSVLEDGYKYDEVIWNNGDISDFNKEAVKFCRKYLRGDN